MAEITSKETALIVAGKKLYNAQDAGRERIQLIISPVAYSGFASGDTMGTGQKIMTGARLLGGVLSCGAGAASQYFHVGIRDFVTKAVIDATAFANGQTVTSAGYYSLANGTKTSGGVDYTVTQDVEAFITSGGAVGPANQTFVLRIAYLGA